MSVIKLLLFTWSKIVKNDAVPGLEIYLQPSVTVDFLHLSCDIVNIYCNIYLPGLVKSRGIILEKSHQKGFVCLCSLCWNGGIIFLPYPSQLLSVPGHLASVQCHQYFFCFGFGRIQNGFRWNVREVITTTSRLNELWILGEIGTGTREQDTTEYLHRRQSVLWRCNTYLCWHQVNEFTYFGVHDLFAMEMLVWKSFTTDISQMQQQRHHMTAHGLQLSGWEQLWPHVT